MSGTVETEMSYNKSNKDLLEINKPIPFKKTNSF